MACPLKRSNPMAPEKFARTAYDSQMAEMFDPRREGFAPTYNAPPWPGARTKQDEGLQSRFCPTCQKEHFIHKSGKHSTPRTAFDNNLQAQWCDNCNTNK